MRAARKTNTRAIVRISSIVNSLPANCVRQLWAQVVDMEGIHEREAAHGRCGIPGVVECFAANGLVYMQPRSV